MKVGVLTAALQELTPREVRDPDPDRAIEDWLEFAQRARRRATSSCRRRCTRPRPTCRPRRCSIRWPTRSTCASRSTRSARRRVQAALDATGVGISDVGYFDNLLHHDPAIRKKKHDFMLRVFDAAALLGVDAVCGFVGRNQQHSMDENLDRLRGAVRPAAEGGEGARPDLPRRAVPDAGLDDRRQLAQQHRLHAGHVDRAAPDLREARRRRSVPHPLRPVARHPDGPGHALDLPVPEGRAATTS